jgi:hypothetical protein
MPSCLQAAAAPEHSLHTIAHVAPTYPQYPTVLPASNSYATVVQTAIHNAYMLVYAQADIINRGYGGFFTSWFVDYMLDSLFNVGSPTLGIIFLGVKDSLTPAVSG